MTELKAASHYARHLIETSLDPLVAISPEGKIFDRNQAMIEMLGLPREQLLGTDFSGYFTDPRQARESYGAVLMDGAIAGVPLTLQHKDGHLTEILYTASNYRDAKGKLLGVVIATRRVTENNRAEQTFRTLIESAPEAMILAGRDDVIQLVNHQTERLFGYKREELLGQAIEILVPTRSREGHPRLRSKFFLEPRLRPMGAGLELRGTRKDGSEFPIEINLSPIETAEGLAVAATVRDVTLQRAASQYARSLIEASIDPLVAISPQGKITDVNEATIKLTDVPRERLVGTDFSDYFTEPERARDGYEQVFAKGYITNYPLTIRHLDKTLTPILYNASVYKDTGANVSGVVATARDVTAQKSAEEEVAAQRARDLDRLAELERFQRLTVGRELKMIELKKEIEELRKGAPQVAAG